MIYLLRLASYLYDDIAGYVCYLLQELDLLSPDADVTTLTVSA